ncbi:MAG: S-layer homology domain-containing protein [Oscillospiraceae bacterium]|nr:S-layer homology domain-containing protein [Oscillospiraceae bacterium]
MKKAMSFLLALIMVVSMVPGTALPAAAAEAEPLQAYYTNENVSVDGALREEHWLLRDKIGSTPIALLNAQNALYIALKTEEKVIDVTVSGKTFKVDLAAGAVMAGGEKIGVAAFDMQNGTSEIEIPMTALGLTYSVGREVDFAITAGTDSYNGKLMLAEKAVKLAESFDDITKLTKGGTTKFGGSTAEVYATQGEGGSLHIQTGDMTDNGYSFHQPNWVAEKLGMDLSRGYELSFTADFNDLNVPAADNVAHQAIVGFAVDVRAEVYLRHSFTADKNGNLMVSQYENTADQTKVIDTGYDLPAKDLFVKFVVDDNFNVDVQINGKSVAKFGQTTRRVAAGTVMFSTCTGRRDLSSPRKNDVAVYDLLITQAAPSEQVTVNTIANADDLKLDGATSEVLWSMPYTVGGTRYGLLYDAENLYIALNTDKSQVDFTLGEQKATAKLGKKPTVALGFTMGPTIATDGKGGYEITIPRNLLKVEGKIPFSITSGDETRSSDLTLGNTSLSVVEKQITSGDGKQDAIAYLNTDKVTMDGKLKENHWYTPYDTQGAAGTIATGAGFMWDANYLYLGAQMFSASRPEAMNLTINGKSMSADISANTATVGDVMGDGQTMEWRIPHAELGLTAGNGVSADYKLEVVGANGTSTLYGKLTMQAVVVVFGDTCDDINAKDYSVANNKLAGTEVVQGTGVYDINTKDGFTGNEYYQMHTPLLNYEGGAYEFVIDLTVESLPHNTRTLGWRGLNWEIRQPGLQTRFCLRSDGNGNVMMDVLNRRDSAALDTGIDFGERAVIRFSVDDNLNPTLYVNDKMVGGFPALDRTAFTISDNLHMPRLILQAMNYDRDPDADGKLNGLNVEVHDMLWTQTVFTDARGAAESAMETVTEKNLLLGADPEDVTKLYLVKSISDTNTGVTSTVTWKAIDKATGKVAANVNTETGVITRGDKPLYFDLIATVTYDGVGVSKTFTFQTKGTKNLGSVGLITWDNDPRTGHPESWGGSSFEYFDNTHNSLVVDQGSSKQFNTITLYDFDDVSRVNKQHLSVYVSNDGKTYTKVYNWLLHQDGKAYTIYNLSETARYVKVHNHHDDLDEMGNKPSFYNAVADMMTVSNNPNFVGANGGFAHKADYKVSNPTGKAVKDYPVFISLTDLGAKTGEYKADCTDFRFTMGENYLAYWYNGVDGFYVRIPDMTAGGAATVTAHWGCASAADFSDGESVFEVMYGNITITDFTRDHNLGSHGRPVTMPNGDIIVAGRTADTRGNTGFVRSTDGGRTFSTVPEFVMRDSDYSGRALGFGGFLVDEEIGRVWAISYSGKNLKDGRTEYRLVISYTDDSGYTWSKPVFLTNPALEPVQDNDAMLENADPNVIYSLTYCNGIKLRDADGKGPNVDYVLAGNGTNHVTKYNCTQVYYSKDGGESWACGENVYMDLDAKSNAENGVTEPAITQLDDGRLYMLMRAQQEGNFYFYEAFSSDYGATWEAGYSKVIASNTSPVMTTYNNQRILLWTSMNSVGAFSYRRTPVHVATTSDNYKSFDHIVDVVFGTSYDGLEEMYSHMFQPGITFTKDGKDAYVAFYAGSQLRRFTEPATGGFLAEDFQDMINYTKGGYDDFEVASLKFEGWMTVDGVVLEVSEDAAVSGQRSLKLYDRNPGSIVHTTRQIPSMKYGTVGAKMMVPATNTDYFALELKAGYNFEHLQHALAAVAVKGDGTVAVCYADEIVPVGKVEPGTWNDYAVSFDIAKNMGKLYVNGKFVSDIKLNTSAPLLDKMVEDIIREVTCIQFMQTEATTGTSDVLYVDDVYFNELTAPLSRTGAESGGLTPVEPPKEEPEDELTFADVKTGDWFYDAVAYATANGIMSGYSADKFGPNDTLNRAMVVQLLYNKEGQPALNGLKHSFSDVPASQWYNNAVTWGSNKGVVSGYGGGVFKPEDAVTVEQIAVILRNYSGSPNGNGDLSKVGNHSDWAADALKWAVEKGILNNVPFTNATEQATRAQAAQMLTNYLRAN